MSNPMPYPPTWTDDDQDGPQWIVYESGEGFQPSYALVRAANALDAEEIGAELSNGWISAESDSVVVVEVR